MGNKGFWVESAGGDLGPRNFTSGAVHPHVDVVEAAEEVQVHVELAGVQERDIQLSVHDGVLTVAGEKHPHNRQEWRQDRYLAERSFGAFRRTISLPPGVDEEGARASFEDGLLTVVFPRKEVPVGKSIPINQ
ncbi:MAG: Hsp20/alpha crystallin family protein [Candidatus Competibacteraceae bacterium]|nr:Hsp20/alpha crystallin family protein [Candidatus Competibacteraceae bacterium]